ncbi:MAG: hypothetical protein V1716_02610 [Candidatus Uhrbacteria bacterium]
MMNHRLIPEMCDLQTAHETVEAAKRAHAKDPKCGAIKQLETDLVCRVLRLLLEGHTNFNDGALDQGVAIVDAIEWLEGLYAVNYETPKTDSF